MTAYWDAKALTDLMNKTELNEDELLQLYGPTVFLPNQQHTILDSFQVEGVGIDPAETIWDISFRQRGNIVTTNGHKLPATRVMMAKLDTETTLQLRALHAVINQSFDTFAAAAHAGTSSADRYANDALDLAGYVTTYTRLMMQGLYLQNVRQGTRYELHDKD